MEGQTSKILAVAIVIVVAVAGSYYWYSSQRPPAREELAVWWPPFGEEIDTYVETIAIEWGEENDVDVTFEVVPWQEMAAKLLTAFKAGTGPDVFYVGGAEYLPTFTGPGYLMQLDDYVTDNDKYPGFAHWYETVWKYGRWNDHYYAIPLLGGGRLLYYNEKLLIDHDITPPGDEITADEFRALLLEIKDKTAGENIIPFGLALKANTGLDLVLGIFRGSWQGHDHIMYEEGKWVNYANTPEIKAALKYLSNLYFVDETWPKRCSGINSAEMEALYVKGEVAFTIASSGWAVWTLKPEDPELYLNTKATRLVGPKGAYSGLVYDTMMVSSEADPDIAIPFLHDFVSKENWKEFMELEGELPPRDDLGELSQYTEDPTLNIYNWYVEQGNTIFLRVPLPVDCLDYWSMAVATIFTENASIDVVLQNIEAKFDEGIREIS